MTWDFCPWSENDGLGVQNLFGKLFFLGRSRGANFFESDVESEEGGEGMRQLFGYEYTESTHNQELQMERQVYYESKTASKPTSLVVENDINITGDWTPSSKSSDTFEDVYEIYPSMRDSVIYPYSMTEAKRLINANLLPQWKSFFRQSRWSIRFAPQQSVNLSMTGIRIAPWRCSMSRLLSDLCRLCKSNPHVKYLALLDPMVRFMTEYHSKYSSYKVILCACNW